MSGWKDPDSGKRLPRDLIARLTDRNPPLPISRREWYSTMHLTIVPLAIVHRLAVVTEGLGPWDIVTQRRIVEAVPPRDA